MSMHPAHYAGSSPVHAHQQHTPLPVLSAQAPFASHPHSLLPTPPSSPPTIGMHPVESTISLLESLVAFYHQERMWVYRTRAQLEMGLLHRALDSQPDGSVADMEFDDDPGSPSHSGSSSDSGKTADSASPSAQTKWRERKNVFKLRLEGISSTRLPTVARGGISKRHHPHTQHRARQSSNLNPASSHQSAMQGLSSAARHAQSSTSMTSTNTPVSFYPPTAFDTATTLTSPYLAHPSFQFSTTSNQQSLTPGMSTPRIVSQHAPATVQQPTHTGPVILGSGGREPTVQILEMFERMMQARMESCERVTKMVREANKPGGIGVGTGVVGGVNLGSVGGPVGGFGGPVGLPVGIGPQEIVGGYHQAQNAGMMAAQTAAQQGFPMA